MNTVYQGYFDKAELALAAYADFSLAPHDGSGVQRWPRAVGQKFGFLK